MTPPLAAQHTGPAPAIALHETAGRDRRVDDLRVPSPASTRRPTPRADRSCTVSNQAGEVPAGAVELPGDERIALAQDTLTDVETRPVVPDTGHEVVADVDLVDAGRLQGVALQVRRLRAVGLRDAGRRPRAASPVAHAAAGSLWRTARHRPPRVRLPLHGQGHETGDAGNPPFGREIGDAAVKVQAKLRGEGVGVSRQSVANASLP